MNNIDLRQATPNDLPFILDIVETTYKEQLIKTYGHFNLEEQADWWTKNLDPNFHKIIEFQGRPAGLYGVSYTDTTIDLELMFLMPEFQGRSIASYLLTKLIDESVQTGKQLVTRSLKSHKDAQKYWLHKGFIVDHEDEKRVYFKYNI